MIFAVSVLAAAHLRATPSTGCGAAHVLAELRSASGGSGWSHVAEVTGSGSIVDAGSKGSFRIARDVKTGRNSFSESLDVGRVGYVYDGTTKWEVDQGGGVHALDAPDSASRAVTDAFIDSDALWTNPARTTCVREAREGSALFDVLRVRPSGGSAADLWIDRSTHLIDRKVEQWPTTAVTEQYADYRRTAGVMLPYRVIRRYDDSTGAPALTVETVRSYRVLEAAVSGDFVRPPDPQAGALSGPSTSLPFDVERGVIVFRAAIDDKGPFDFTFDPGAQGVLTTTAAGPLGLTPGTMVHLESIQVGEARIDELDVPVYAGSPSDIFARGSSAAAPIAGSLGPELLDRFDVRLDYAQKVMTLAPPGSLGCGGGDAERFVLQEDDDIPLVHATVDGHGGLVQFDVRAPASLLLFEPFLDRTALPRSGTVRSLSIGTTVLHDVPARYLSSSSGKFASRTEAGLIGSQVLSRFVTTLDFRHRTICFQPGR